METFRTLLFLILGPFSFLSIENRIGFVPKRSFAPEFVENLTLTHIFKTLFFCCDGITSPRCFGPSSPTGCHGRHVLV
jgi:hypothetical protein